MRGRIINVALSDPDNMDYDYDYSDNDVFDDWEEQEERRNIESPPSSDYPTGLTDSEPEVSGNSDGEDSEVGVEDSDDAADDDSPIEILSSQSSRLSSEADSEDSLFVGGHDDDEEPMEAPPNWREGFLSRVQEERRRVSGLLADARTRLQRIEAVDLEMQQAEGNGGPDGAARAAAPGENRSRQNRRHHPYHNPQPDNPENQNFRHNRPRAGFIDFEVDELIEMEVAPARRRSRGAPHNRRIPVVIDLTDEPSSPERDAPAAAGADPQPFGYRPPANRNPRRQASVLQRTPSLARSDGSLLGNGSRTVPIDLTMDDDPAPPPAPPPQQPPRRNPDRPANPPDFLRGEFMGFAGVFNRARAQFDDIPQFAQMFRGFINRQAVVDHDVQFVGRIPVNPIGNNMPNLHYAFAGGVRRAPDPKPVHVPPPAAPEGFTRNTGGEDALVCPGCENELQFCEEDEAAKQKSPPTKKAKSRKDMEEHHFWALKDCGHVRILTRHAVCFTSANFFFLSLSFQVYCKGCYEKRGVKKLEKSPFRQAPDNARKMVCSVPECKTEVTTKWAWVGLFL